MNLTIETAVANQSGAMEARDHFKNGASLKSQMSRRNKYLKKLDITKSFTMILSVALCITLFSCNVSAQTNVQYYKGIVGEGGIVYMALSGNACMLAVGENEKISHWDVQPVVRVGSTGTTSMDLGYSNRSIVHLIWDNDGSIRIKISRELVTLKPVNKNEFDEVLKMLK
ncbi:MAG: hypothetical protein FWG22_02270 [Prolixibacteraceae bacterium]|nr:hypothetical protein [Prolixibacteraceae bacterium]